VIDDVINIDIVSFTSFSIQDLDFSQVIFNLILVSSFFLNSNKDFVFKIMLMFQQSVNNLDLSIVCSGSIVQNFLKDSFLLFTSFNETA